ncbi:MAG: peptidoglycan bridge formation glycyltransferase FemA/FemB family protein [Sedimentisphaerales bacterium]|jgi:lipid II:glycine glycyltransferase (peptidoglycan interpeptide bridge formation enzyme)
MYTLEEVKYTQWSDLLKKCNKANLLQTWEYGEAKRIVEHWDPCRYVILDNDQMLGIVQVLTKTLPLIGRVVRINRGPLFFDRVYNSECSEKIMGETMQTIFKNIVDDKKCYLRIAPEIENKHNFDTMSDIARFHPLNSPFWSSVVIDLLLEEDLLFENLHGKWRNLLRKSQKMGLELEEVSSEETMNFLIEKYRIFQKEKGFSGISEKILIELSQQFNYNKQIQISFARKNMRRIAGILIIGHGNSCTYLVGWNSKEGRDLQANYFLLWQAVINCKNQGYRWFDLGGIDDKMTPGVAHFKKGLGGREYTLAGEFEMVGKGFFPFMVSKLSRFL